MPAASGNCFPCFVFSLVRFDPVSAQLIAPTNYFSLYSTFHWFWVLSYVLLVVAYAFFHFNYASCIPENWRALCSEDIALVTGGSGGLGLALVKSLVFDHNAGKVFILDIKEPEFQFDDRVEFISCDVGSEDELNQTLNSVIMTLDSQGKHISVLINNAGVRCSGPLLNLHGNSILQAFGTNTLAPIRVIRRVVGHHLEKYPTLPLSVVSVSSVLGIFGPRNLLVYSASKSALIQIHECLGEELRSHRNIRMLLVMPGQLTTDMFKDVSPTKVFFAPLVNHTGLATRIVGRISRGQEGVLCEPFYANFLPIVKILPMSLQRLCRWFTQMDEKIPDIP